MPTPTPVPVATLIDRLATLPQAPRVTQAHAQAWAEAAMELTPADADRTLARLRGFDPDELAVLVHAHEGAFHPRSDARAITRQKLLLDPPDPPPDEDRRAQALAPLSRQEHRREVLARGGAVRQDLLDKLQASAPAKDCPWLVGEVGDFVEEAGRVVLVDYVFPAASQFDDLDGGQASRSQQVRLHHLLARARAAGIQVDGLRVYAFGADAWRGVERAVAVDPAVSDLVAQVGSHFWNECVLAGVPAPALSTNQPQALEDLALLVDGLEVQVPVPDVAARAPDGSPVAAEHYPLAAENLPRLRQQIADLGAEVFGQAMVKAEAERMRDTLTRAIRQALPLKALPADTGRIDLGPVRLKVDWVYHEQHLLDATRAALGLMGQGEEDIDLMLAADNFHRPASYSAETLIQVLKEKKGIDALADPDFLPALVAPRTRRQDTLVALLRDLEKMLPQPVDWAQLVDYDRSSLGVEVVRAPTVGFGKDLRQATLDRVRAALAPLARAVGLDHARAHLDHARQAAAATAAPAARPRRRTRG